MHVDVCGCGCGRACGCGCGMHVDVSDVVVVMLVIMDVMCSLLRTRCECLVIQRVIFHGFHPIDHCGCQDTYKFLI